MSIVSIHDFYPDGNVRTDPQQLSERQKEQARKNIGAMSEDQQISGGLTPEQEQQLAKIDDKLDKSQLQTAINQALLQAQQSGLFDGQDGQTPQLSIGTVATLEPGAKATASITGPTENLKLNLGIPRGKDGGAGKAGGYYTPKVTEIAPGEYQITFETSAPDMPAVGPVQLTLPSGGGTTPEQLETAVQQALQSAKDSGDFDGPKGDRGPAGLEGFYSSRSEYPKSTCVKYSTQATNWNSGELNETQGPEWKVPGSVILLAIRCDNGDVYISIQEVLSSSRLQPRTYWVSKRGIPGLNESGGGSGGSPTIYRDPTEIPYRSSMQLIFYGTPSGNVTIKFGNATKTFTIRESTSLWRLWVQTNVTDGSLIGPDGSRDWMDMDVVPETISVSSSFRTLIVIVI